MKETDTYGILFTDFLKEFLIQNLYSKLNEVKFLNGLSQFYQVEGKVLFLGRMFLDGVILLVVYPSALFCDYYCLKCISLIFPIT